MHNFVNWMEKYFIPVASKIGAQRHFVAIRDSFMVTIHFSAKCTRSCDLSGNGFRTRTGSRRDAAVDGAANFKRDNCYEKSDRRCFGSC